MRRSLSPLLFVLFLSRVAGLGDPLDPSPLFVEGYAGQVSDAPGEEVILHVSTTASSYAIEITRVGGRRDVLMTRSGLKGTAPSRAGKRSSHGCDPPASLRFPIPEEWPSGYYQRGVPRG